MLNTKKIEIAVAEAERELSDCWLKLVAITNAADGAQTLDAIVSFQPMLGLALYKLETLYTAVCGEARELLGRKAKLNPKWMRGRIHTLHGYKHIIKRTADIGKLLGDSFAWIFYQNDRALLLKHSEQPPNPHPPIGIGGKGEIEFIRNFPKFGNYFVVAHSTTTFLRIGDVSLIDPIDLKVAAIGELKTKANGETHLMTTINLVGSNLKEAMLPRAQPSDQHGPEAPIPPLPLEILERLKRQIKRMQDSFRPMDESRMLPPMQVTTTFNCSKLAGLYRQSSIRNWSHVKADRALLMVGIRLPGSSLFQRLTLKSAGSRALNLSRTAAAARGIVDKSLPDNSVRLHWLAYPAHARYELPFGMRPLFWWPLDKEVIEALVFKRFISMTMYNPVFLIRDVRNLGLQVQTGENGALRIWKQRGEKRIEFKGISYFFELVQAHLFPDSSVVNVIATFVEAVEKADFQHSACVNMNLDFAFQ